MTDTAPEIPTFVLQVNGQEVEVPDQGYTLLDVLRSQLGLLSVKDGCAPQGQCGCCTVLVDGKPRVACVTPVRRVRGRSVVTLEGLDEARRERWGSALCASGGSQCGFCTPGIILRLDPLAPDLDEPAAVESDTAKLSEVDAALLAHLCRCTGWQTIEEAFELFASGDPIDRSGRDLAAAAQRAAIEGRAAQQVSPDVALGAGGFAADTAPEDHLVALLNGEGEWVVAESLPEARVKAEKVQGRRTTAPHVHPLDLPEGEWAATLRTTWVDAAYLETDAAWCQPGEEPTVSLAANGGAFGAKRPASPADAHPKTEAGDTDTTAEASEPLDVAAVAKALADGEGRPVLALASREDVARQSPKRPPVAGGIQADGTGVLRVVATPGIAEVVAAVAPGLVVEEIEVPGPPTSAQVRAAGWAEALVLASALQPADEPIRVQSPEGAEATAEINDGVISVTVRCGQVLDETVLRSYCIGAAHMGWSWLTSEAMLVDHEGTVHDLTIRSFGIVRAVDTPKIEVTVMADDGPPINGSDAVFAAVASAGWRTYGRATDWPVGPAA